MEPYFKTTIEVEDLSKDDILILQKRLKRNDIILKIFKYTLLMAITSLVLLFLPFKYNEKIDFFIAEYYFEIGGLLFFIVILILCFGIEIIYYRFIIEQALKNNYVVVCTGVLTEIWFKGGAGVRGSSLISIGSRQFSIAGPSTRKLKVGTCIQYRFFGTHIKSYCVSVKRYNQIMYDHQYIFQIEEKDLELSLDSLMMYTMLDEIVNYQMYQVKMGKRDGLRGILLAIACKILNPFYKVEYDKEQGNTVKKPDLSEYKSKLNKKE